MTSEASVIANGECRTSTVDGAIEGAAYPELFYRYINSRESNEGIYQKNISAVRGIRNIRLDTFSEAISDLGINRDTALRLVSIAIERKYAELGRKVHADVRAAVVKGRQSFVFAVIEMHTDSSGQDNVRVIDVPLIPGPHEIYQVMYQALRGTWTSAVARVIAKCPSSIILKITEATGEASGGLALLPYSELAYEDDFECIETGDLALVAIGRNANINTWEIKGRKIKPEWFATRAMDRFPTIVGPRIGIRANGFTYGGLCVYEMDQKESLSAIISEAKTYAGLLGVERLTFVHKTHTTYADTLVRRMAKDLAGVTLRRTPIIRDDKKTGKRFAKIHVAFGDGRKMSGKHGRNIRAICRSAWIDSLEIVETAI